MLIAVLFFAAAFLLAAGEARAGDQANLKKHYEKAMELYDQEDYEGALEAFVKAKFYRPGWELGVNIARCLEKLERYGEAATELALALEEGEDDIPAGTRAKLEERLSKLAGKAAILSIEGGLLEHEDLYIDGRPSGGVTTGGNLYLDPGEYDVEVRVGDHVLVSKKTSLTKPGAREVLAFEREKVIEIDTGKKGKSGKLKDRWALWSGVALFAAGLGLNIGGAVVSYNIRSYNDDLGEYRNVTLPSADVCSCFREGADLDACFGGAYAPTGDDIDKVQDICGQDKSLAASQLVLFLLGHVLATAGVALMMVDLDKQLDIRKEKKKKLSLNLRPVFDANSAGLFLEGRF